MDFRASEHWNLRAGYSHQDYQIDALFTGNFGLANNMTLLQGRRVRGQIYTNHDDTVDVQATAQYALSRARLRLLLGAQYGMRRFDQWAAQAPNDPALGTNPTASPFPLWDLSDPSTWTHAHRPPLCAHRESHRPEHVLPGQVRLQRHHLGLLRRPAARSRGWALDLHGDAIHRTPSPNRSPTRRPDHGQRGHPPVRPALQVDARPLRLRVLSESFVPGGAARVTNPDGTTSPDVPTRGQGIDVGLKSAFFGGRASGTLTFFDIRNRNIVNDIAHTDATGALVLDQVQSGTQRSRGVELDATIAATTTWQLYLSYSYMDARITEFSGNDAAVLAQDPATLDAAGQANYRNVLRFHNAPLQMSAPHLANFWTRYGLTQRRLIGFHIGGGINFVYDQTLLPDTPQFAHQTYALLNAMVGRTWVRRSYAIDLRLTGKNLADEHYRPSQSTRGRPREVLLTLGARF